MAKKKEKHNKKSAFDDPKTMSEFRDYIIAGNAVTVPVVEAIGKKLAENEKIFQDSSRKDK